jgi:hypothetical protein
MDIIYSSSFRLLPARQLKLASPEDHKYIFDVHDIAVLQEASDNPERQLGILGEMGGVWGIASALRSDIKQGLPADDQQTGFARRKLLYGENVFPVKEPETFWELCYGAIEEDRMLQILIVAGIVSLAIGIADVRLLFLFLPLGA